jgi:tripartite-type tricarboxylate transporter receptor subunit TctC
MGQRKASNIAFEGCSLMKISVLAALVGAIATASPAAAQFASGQQVTLNVGFAAGGSADIVARLIGSRLGEKLGGATVIVENRAGASGEIAARLVANAEPNGATILATTTAIALSETLSKNKGYAARDLRAISIAATTPDSLVINGANPAKTLQEFVANAKGKSITFGSAGVGTSPFIAAAYFFKTLAKVDAVHVPFPGGAPALNALVGGHIDAVAITLPTIVPFVSAGTLRGVAVASSERLKELPDLPTYIDGGYSGFTTYTWIGFFVSSKVKDDVAQKINAAFNDVLRDPGMQQKLREIGFEPTPATLEQANDQFKAEVRTWGDRIQAIGMAAQ